MNWFLTAFWIFIAAMLIWEFYDYNRSFDQAQAAAPKQEHYFFYNTNTETQPSPAQGPKSIVNGPDVEQVAYSTKDGVPASGSFTSYITLKNLGTAKAVDVQIMVRPYRGIVLEDFDITMRPDKILDDNDPLSLFGQYVSAPDLAPGESATVTAVFNSRPSITPGNNPKPQILFGTEKANP
jgi:hypothetical protein